MDVIQVAALAVAGVLLAVQFKSGKAEYGIYLGRWEPPVSGRIPGSQRTDHRTGDF